MKTNFRKSEPPENAVNTGIFTAPDAQRLLGSLRELGSGRIICQSGALSLAIGTDFRSIDPKGRHLIFSGGLLELVPGNFQILVSTASCGLGLGVSLLDRQKNIRIVFHFCHGSQWGKWLDKHIQTGLLLPHSEPDLAPKNLCWCELWPETPATSFAVPGSLLEQRFTTVTASSTLKATLHSRDLELTAVVRPSSFDVLASSIRFWDRPRTRVCYADLSSVDPQQHDTFVALRN